MLRSREAVSGLRASFGVAVYKVSEKDLMVEGIALNRTSEEEF